jgi:hypothetical protein
VCALVPPAVGLSDKCDATESWQWSALKSGTGGASIRLYHVPPRSDVRSEAELRPLVCAAEPAFMCPPRWAGDALAS